MLYRDRGIDEQLAYVDRANSQLAKTGSEFIILGPDSHFDGYDTEIEMSQDEWDTFIANLKTVMNNAEDHGLSTAIPPHWGMAIASEAHVERMLGCCEVGPVEIFPTHHDELVG